MAGRESASVTLTSFHYICFVKEDSRESGNPPLFILRPDIADPDNGIQVGTAVSTHHALTLRIVPKARDFLFFIYFFYFFYYFIVKQNQTLHVWCVVAALPLCVPSSR